MSEQADQPVVAETPVVEAPAGVDATAPAADETDIDTESFDRMEVPDDDEAEAGDGQPAEVADPDAPPAEADDIEFETEDGTKLKVPKALEAHLLRQKDYTQKTQAVAEKARELETKATELASRESQQAESLKTFREEHLAVAQHETVLKSIDERLGSFAKVTPEEWATLRTQEPDRYEKLRAERQLLRDTRGDYEEALTAAKTNLAAKEADLTTRQQEAHKADLAKAWQATSATLAKEIPEWSAEKGQAIATFAMKEFGYSPEELQLATDPRAWKMANALKDARAEIALLKTNQKQRTATEAALKPQAVTPAIKPQGTAPKPTGVVDSLSPEEWLRRRNAHIARKQARG
jgi:hypothetical protein